MSLKFDMCRHNAKQRIMMTGSIVRARLCGPGPPGRRGRDAEPKLFLKSSCIVGSERIVRE